MRAEREGGYNESISVSTVCFGGRLALLDWPSKTYLKQLGTEALATDMGKEVIVGHSYGKSYRPAASGWLMPAPRSWRKLHDKVRLMFATAENEYQTEDGGNRILQEVCHDSASLRVC